MWVECLKTDGTKIWDSSHGRQNNDKLKNKHVLVKKDKILKSIELLGINIVTDAQECWLLGMKLSQFQTDSSVHTETVLNYGHHLKD